VDREDLARITEGLSDLIGRMVEFQKEMEPFLKLLAEPDPPAPGDERPGPGGE